MYIDSNDYADNLESQLSMATDLANSWAREMGVEECRNPYTNGALRNLIDRLWNHTNLRKTHASLRNQ